MKEKHCFYDKVIGDWDMHSVCDLFMCLSDFNGHVGRYIDGVHLRYGVGQRILEGRMLLVFCQEKELYVSNT